MNHTLLRCCAILMLLGFGLFWHKPAHAAIACSASMSSLAFGSVDPQSSQTDSNATLSYTCTNSKGGGKQSAMICFSIGEPAGGPTDPRQMHDAAGDSLDFQLYQDPAHSIVWGSQFFGSPTPVQLAITLGNNASTSGTLTLYGRVLGNQTTAVPGAYADDYGPGDTAITINEVHGNNPPATCGGTTSARFGSFVVFASVVPKCTITANPLDFGNVGLLTSAIDATTTLEVQCSDGTPYNVGLNAGQNGGNVDARRMVLGANAISYQLYRDSSRTQVWGDTVDTDTVAGSGTGNPQSLTVYGRVTVQPTPPAGNYNDTIVVTVTY